jgi:ankyrin repeat protein
LCATKNGHCAVVKLLLETGQVDVNLGDSHNRTPLWWAAERGHDAVVRLLLGTGQRDMGQVDQTSYDYREALWWADRNSHSAVVKLMFETARPTLIQRHSEMTAWWRELRYRVMATY